MLPGKRRASELQRNIFPLSGARAASLFASLARFDTLNFSHFVNFQYKRKKRTNENKCKRKATTTAAAEAFANFRRLSGAARSTHPVQASSLSLFKQPHKMSRQGAVIIIITI